MGFDPNSWHHLKMSTIDELEPHHLEPLIVNGEPVTHSVIADATRRISREVYADYGDQDLVLVSILTGAMTFSVDFGKELASLSGGENLFSDSMRVESYRDTKSNGKPVVTMGLKDPEFVKGKHVLVVDDIGDTLHTWQEIFNYFSDKGVLSVEMIALLAKDDRYEVPIPPKYVGIHIPNEFVVGEGLDWNGCYRWLQGIWKVVKHATDYEETEIL